MNDYRNANKASILMGSRALIAAWAIVLVIGCEGGGTSTNTTSASSSGSGGEGGKATSSSSSTGSGGAGGSGTASGGAGGSGTASGGTGGTGGSGTASGGAGGSGGMPPTNPRCHAGLFDGVHSIAVAPPILEHNPVASFTVEAWVYPTALPSQYGIVAGHHAGIAQKPSYNLAIDANGRAVFAFSPDGASIVLATASATVPLNKWSHVAGVFDSTSQKIYIYIDGGATSSSPAGAAKVFAIDNVPFDIGRESPMTNPENPFKGYIDEVRLSSVARYNTVFVPEEKFANDPVTIALYHFDESSGQTTADSSSNDNDAILQQNAMLAMPPGCP